MQILTGNKRNLPSSSPGKPMLPYLASISRREGAARGNRRRELFFGCRRGSGLPRIRAAGSKPPKAKRETMNAKEGFELGERLFGLYLLFQSVTHAVAIFNIATPPIGDKNSIP